MALHTHEKPARLARALAALVVALAADGLSRIGLALVRSIARRSRRLRH